MHGIYSIADYMHMVLCGACTTRWWCAIEDDGKDGEDGAMTMAAMVKQ